MLRNFNHFFKHTVQQRSYASAVSIQLTFTQVDFSISWKRTHFTNRVVLLSIKIFSIYEFYHYLNNGIWLEKDIFRFGLIIE